MIPWHRTQFDGLQDIVSMETGLVCDPKGDKTRQEFKAEADLNVLLRRFGGVPTAPGEFGEWDFTTTLQDAMHAVHAAQKAHASLPDKLRQVYPTWEALHGAIAAGTIQVFPIPDGADSAEVAEGVPAGGKAPAAPGS